MYSILVIEDDPIVRRTLNRILASEGYAVSFAVDAAKGLETCIQNKPDLILLDVHLPDGNGIELCKKIKGDPRLLHIPILILTGEAVSVENRTEGLEAGADDYIIKPFNLQELLYRIKRVLKPGFNPQVKN